MGRGKADNEAEGAKLDLILSSLQDLNSRLNDIQGLVSQHGKSIEQLSTKHNVVENFILKLNKDIRDANVADACGVDVDHLRKNQLIGENSRGKDAVSAEEKLKRRKKERIGGISFTIFCVTYAGLMVCSFLDILPVFAWERKDPIFFHETIDLLGGNMSFPFILSGIYLVVIFGIQSYMKEKKAFSLRTPLAIWSLVIGLFSLFGSLRTIPALAKMISRRGWEASICEDTRYDWLYYNPAGTWTWYFILSKIPELIDTLFIVLRKGKLITLHWYHHITVLIFCWHSWATVCINGIFFSSMNLTVHAFMYIFYALAAIGFRPSLFAQYITIIQILQMIVGTAITMYVNYHQWFIVPPQNYDLLTLRWSMNVSLEEDLSPNCKINPTNALAGLLMYASYLYLFCVFFYYAYLKPVKSSNVSEEKQTKLD